MYARTLAAAVAAISITVMSPRAAPAQEPVVGVDGCAILAVLVYSEVTREGFGGPGQPGVWPGPGEVTICNEATRRVTMAFTSALRQMNIFVSWGEHPGDTGDYCLSHDLAQCYPNRSPFMPPFSDTQAAFVAGSWEAVKRAVAADMRSGTVGDVVRFERASLERRLRLALADSSKGGLLRGTQLKDRNR